MQLPLQQTQVRDLALIQTKWKAAIDPVLANPLNSVAILNSVRLLTGTNVLNHFLGQLQQGWFLTDIQGAATIYRDAPFNSSTLSLNASADVTVSIGVF